MLRTRQINMTHNLHLKFNLYWLKSMLTASGPTPIAPPLVLQCMNDGKLHHPRSTGRIPSIKTMDKVRAFIDRRTKYSAGKGIHIVAHP